MSQEPSTSASPASDAHLERVLERAKEEDALRAQFVAVQAFATLAGPVMLVMTALYLVGMLIIMLAGVGDGIDGLKSAFGPLVALNVIEGAVVAPCLWLRRRRDRLKARLDGLLRESA